MAATFPSATHGFVLCGSEAACFGLSSAGASMVVLRHKCNSFLCGGSQSHSGERGGAHAALNGSTRATPAHKDVVTVLCGGVGAALAKGRCASRALRQHASLVRASVETVLCGGTERRLLGSVETRMPLTPSTRHHSLWKAVCQRGGAVQPTRLPSVGGRSVDV